MVVLLGTFACKSGKICFLVFEKEEEVVDEERKQKNRMNRVAYIDFVGCSHFLKRRGAGGQYDSEVTAFWLSPRVSGSAGMSLGPSVEHCLFPSLASWEHQ